MKYKDYYATLGVPRDATLEQIKKAYRQLARKHHPDMAKAGGSEERFKDAAEAYATLRDPEKRAAYDDLGRRPAGEEFAPPPQWRQAHGGQFHGAQGLDDIDLADLADLMAAMGHGPGRAGTSAKAHPMRGRDFESQVRISLEDAYRGSTVHLNLSDGESARTLEVTIPQGVTEGQKLRLRGKGGPGHHGGPDGDIYLHISLGPHPVFRVDRHDLYFDLALAPWEAALGTEVQVPTLDGPVLLTVPALTSAGRKLRLRGRGLAHGRATPPEGRGDLYAVVQIASPPSLTPRERELYQELAKASSFNPRSGGPS